MTTTKKPAKKTAAKKPPVKKTEAKVIDKADIGSLVYAIMRDPDLNAHDRAQESVALIEAEMQAEFDLAPGTQLFIPPEWQHRVPTEHIVVITEVVEREPDIDGDGVETEPDAPVKWWQR